MKKRFAVKFFLWFFPLFFILNACSNDNPAGDYQPVFASDTSKQNVIIIGFPNFSYSETAGPLIEYLNAHLPGTTIKVQACVDWDEFNRFLQQGKFDLALINGLVACEAMHHGYSILGKVSIGEPYSSFIFTQKNPAINKVTDLKGKKLALVQSNTIPGTMMGLYYLYEHGLDVNLHVHKENVSSFEATILSVYAGKSDAGICLRRNWNVYVRDNPEILSKLEIKWETPAFEQNAVLVKNTVNKQVASDLMRLLFAIQDAKDARPALEKIGISGFEKADSSTYKPMLDFKKKYDSVIF